MTRSARGALALLLVLLAGGAGLLAFELADGSLSYGEETVADPCLPRAPFPGEGIDATVQRIALDGLDGAACALGTTREELVLSFEPRTGVDPIPWDEETIEAALRSGLLRAVDEAERRDSIGAVTALVLRELIERAPLEFLIGGAAGIAELLD